ncbi:hypothetical protein C8R44DRAFT_359679 [Mycena epipterygia]|nr:hypothetical protein C8R44DRAFT_359679 [Mycena epipterygia]
MHCTATSSCLALVEFRTLVALFSPFMLDTLNLATPVSPYRSSHLACPTDISLTPRLSFTLSLLLWRFEFLHLARYTGRCSRHCVYQLSGDALRVYALSSARRSYEPDYYVDVTSFPVLPPSRLCMPSAD